MPLIHSTHQARIQLAAKLLPRDAMRSVTFVCFVASATDTALVAVEFK